MQPAAPKRSLLASSTRVPALLLLPASLIALIAIFAPPQSNLLSSALGLGFCQDSTNLLAAAEAAAESTPDARERLRQSFLRQMQDGASRLNLGLAYWIELNRQGHLYRTSSLARFQSGDQIRFHVLPNSDGYVYIVMYKGTSGTKSVLFPPPEAAVDNFVKSGAECVVPREGSLEFDQVPGTEQVGLLLSRKKIDPVAYLASIKHDAGTKSPAASSASAAAKAAALRRDQGMTATNDASDLEKSFDAIFGGQGGGAAGQVKVFGREANAPAPGRLAESGNPGALEILVSDGGVLRPEEPTRVLASPSTALVVNDDPDAVVLVDFCLTHN